MKSKNMFNVAFVLIATNFAVAQTAVSGVVSNHHGTICKAYKGSDQQNSTNSVDGFSVYKSARNVIVSCPLTRNTTNSQGANIYVDIKHFGTHYTNCAVFSKDYRGNVIAVASASWTGTGFKELNINMKGSWKSNRWSDYIVSCTIPGYGNGRILGIDLEEH